MITGRLAERGRRLELAPGVDDLRALLALGLGLPRHRALHLVRQVDVLDLDHRDLDPPRVGVLVDDLLQVAFSLSRSESSSSSSAWPSTDRSVVCESWVVA